MRVRCLSRPVCSLLQKEPGWEAGRRTKPLLLYCRLQRKLKEGIVARRKPLHYISPCRQNNECINAKKHALTHLLHYCAHSYLYLNLCVPPVDALTCSPPMEPVKEWEADKVGQKLFLTSSQERMLFFFFFVLLGYRDFPIYSSGVSMVCFLSSCRQKGVWSSSDFYFHSLSLCFQRNMFNNSSLIFS